MNILGNLSSLDKIILIHRGSPSDRVKMRWLDVLNEYGISPIRLIMMMDLNRGAIKSLSPFRWSEKVRFNWDMMVLMNRIVIMLIRKFIDQKGI